MASLLPFRTLALCVALSALAGCRDYAYIRPGATPAPPEPPPLQYRIKRVVSGGCVSGNFPTTDFAYVKALAVSKTTQPEDSRELGIPNTTYTYDAQGRLLAAAYEEQIKRQSGQRALVYTYSYTPTSIIEVIEDRYADGHQEPGARNTYTLAGGLIVSQKEQYYDAGVPVTNQWTYEYTNGNVTRVVCKGQYGQTKLDYSFEYDDKPNPFYRNAANNWVGSLVRGGISYESFSRNNVVKLTIRSPYSDQVTVRTRQYTYNEQGLPLTQRNEEGCQVARFEYETY